VCSAFSLCALLVPLLVHGRHGTEAWALAAAATKPAYTVRDVVPSVQTTGHCDKLFTWRNVHLISVCFACLGDAACCAFACDLQAPSSAAADFFCLSAYLPTSCISGTFVWRDHAAAERGRARHALCLKNGRLYSNMDGVISGQRIVALGLTNTTRTDISGKTGACTCSCSGFAVVLGAAISRSNMVPRGELSV